MLTERNLRRLMIVAVVLAVAAGAIASLVRTQRSVAMVPRITDDTGASLVLRGFSTAGSAKLSPTGHADITPTDIARERADMGTNFVRLLISWRAVEPVPGKYDQRYLDGVAQRVKWYADLGYHVMFDMHQDVWGQGVTPDRSTGNGAPVWATFTDGKRVARHDRWEFHYLEPGVIAAFDNFWANRAGIKDRYVAAWRAVAQRFANEPNVIAYDLMNEPYGGTHQGPAFEAGALTDLYQATTEAIREVDDSTWVCLESQAIGVNWGTPSALGRVEDPRPGAPRIAYCPHLYPLPMDLGSGFNGTTERLVRGSVDTWLHHTLAKATELGSGSPVPVILGEFGLDTTKPGAIGYVDEVLDVADEHGFGVAYWSRDDGAWGPYENGRARNLVAAMSRPYPRLVKGSLTGLASGDDRLRFEVGAGSSFAAVYLPRSGFPGVRVVNGQVVGVQVRGAEIQGWDARRRLLNLTLGAGEVTVTP